MKNDAHLSAVPLQSWLRIQREAPPLGARAEALRQALLGCPQVRQAWYLAWQPASQLTGGRNRMFHLTKFVL